MTAPSCPVHNRPMKDWGDAFKCTAKIGEDPMGKARYCDERVAKAAGAQPAAAAPAQAQSAALAVVPEMPQWLAAPLAPYANNPAVELLLPSVPVNAELGYGHKVAVSIVSVSPNPADKEVFKVGTRDGQEVFAYTKQGIEKMAEAAGIQVRTERVDDRRNPDYCEMRAFAAMKGSSGQLIIRTATKAFDMAAVEAEAIRTAMKFDRALSEPQAREKVAGEMSSFRKHLLARTESGAVLRAMRSLLALKSGITAAQIAKPKVLARVEFNPEPKTDSERRMLMEMGAASAFALYGPQAPGTRHVGADVVEVTEDEPEMDYEDLTLTPPDDDRPAALSPTSEPDWLGMAMEGMQAIGLDAKEQAALMRQHPTDYRALYNAVSARAAS